MWCLSLFGVLAEFLIKFLLKTNEDKIESSLFEDIEEEHRTLHGLMTQIITTMSYFKMENRNN